MAGQYWRVAGLTYLQYANICGSIVRGALKEPFRSANKNREAFSSSITNYANGKELNIKQISNKTIKDLSTPQK
ncbi:ATP synthase epsilon chain [Tieghemostelium lacteum]|uniref:ATP synthase epsilon chain n=1 Tax=Tieghemostelium lacteum TaxID=361077 RepID=A0A151Z6S1_TIELA|nr:ATP synthase epsilon chain [Tieghemostelium lacteum]|eukprot:KYQ89484.1 ATP synthase epsilon chain [Tieghemostelium lacteum]